MTDVLDRPVRFQRTPDDAYKARLVSFGMSDAMAQATLDMWTAYGEGLDLAEPRTAASTTPTSFRQWCEDTLKPAIETAAARAPQ